MAMVDIIRTSFVTGAGLLALPQLRY